MSADDNILAGITGFSEGVRDVLVPYMQTRQKAQYQNQLEAAQSARQLGNEKAITAYKAPFQQQEDAYKSQLATQQESSKFNTEGYLNYNDLPPDLATKLGVKPGTRIRKEALSPYATLIGKEETDKNKQTQSQNVNTKKVNEELAMLQGTLHNYDSLMSTYDKAKGDSGVLGGAAKSALSTITGGVAYPAAKTYNDHKTEFMQVANKQLTGMSQRTQEAINAGVKAIPEFAEAPESAQMKRERFRGLITDRMGQLQGLIGTNGQSAMTPFSQPSSSMPEDASFYSNQKPQAVTTSDAVQRLLQKHGGQ